MKPFPSRILFSLLFLAGGLNAATGPVEETQYVSAALVADQDVIAPGQTFEIGVRYDILDAWHIYWKNPGDTGLVTKIDWELPEGFEVGELRWPTPDTYIMSGLMNYVYEGTVVLTAEVRAPETLQPGSEATIRAQTSWLVCKDICVPGDAAVSLALPVASTSEADDELAEVFERTRRSWPRPSEAWRVTGEIREAVATILIEPVGPDAGSPEDLYFFPETTAIDPNAAQQVDFLGDGMIRMVLELSKYHDGPVNALPGVLKSATPWEAGDSDFFGLRVDPLAADGPSAIVAGDGGGAANPAGAAGVDASAPAAGGLSVPQALLFALLGGLILNLMPCVFPVLGIKIMGFANQAGEDHALIRKHGLVFGAGVVLSVWVLVGVLLALRAGGEALGWGFQLQDPRFVAFLIALFFLFGLNLSGVFEIGTSLVGVGQNLQHQSGLSGSFFSGVLAVVVATPCTGPFMAPAIGFAFAQPAWVAFLIFTLLAAGLALPYVVLSFQPALIKKLPRPGPWMESFKQFMAFPLFATALWLLSVFVQQTGARETIGLLRGLLLMGFAAWIYGRWGAPHRKSNTRRLAYAFALIFLLGGGYDALRNSKFPEIAADGETRVAQKTASEEFGVTWETWSAERVADLVQAGKTVYVDFTAAWCLTCQANKRVVFGSEAVRERFNRNDDLVLMKADWTRRDPAITAELERFDRSGVPLNVIYTQGAEPRILPTALTPGIVMNALDEVR